MAASDAKRPRLEIVEEMAVAANKTRIVLALFGSFSPITNLHLRMFGMLQFLLLLGRIHWDLVITKA